MKAKTPCIKVSVSLPQDVHDWLKNEADLQTKKRGSLQTVSSILQEILHESRTKSKAHSHLGQAMPDRIDLNEKPSKYAPATGAEILTPHKRSAGGSANRATRYQTKRQAKS